MALMTVYLSIFELLLFTFQAPLGTNLADHTAYDSIWNYLLRQEYQSFIDLDELTLHEKRHLLDVKRILDETHILWMMLLPFALLSFVFFFSKIRDYFLISAFFFKFMLIVLFGYDFLASFEHFHALLFVSNSWTFTEDTVLIKLFPLNYFQEFLMLFCLLSLLVMLLVFVLKKR